MQHTPKPESDPTSRTFYCRSLGRLSLHRASMDGQPIMLAGKPLALLTYVALAPGGRVERDRAAELLWPTTTSSDPRHSLRQALYRLRAATDGDDLVSAVDGELVVHPIVEFDFRRLETLVAEGDLEGAVALPSGHFLGDFEIPESREFEDWVEVQSIRFGALWADAASELVQKRVAAGAPDGAIAVAERLAAARPFDEEPVRLLMLALAAAGRHAIALSRFAAYADLLATEADEHPSGPLSDYASELRRFVSFRSSSSQPGLPFVGRIEEWSVLEQMWAEALVGTGSTVLIEGAAGLGKTRLIEELRARVRAGDGLVLSAKCYEPEQSVPYGAIAQALSALGECQELDQLSPAWLAEAARLLPELREQRPSLPAVSVGQGSEASKRRLHQALARCLEVVSRETPVLLTLDDLQWADPASLEVLHSLTHHLRNRAVMVLTTYRPAELSPAARSFARSLCASALAKLLVLKPLTENEVSDLLVALASFDDFELQAAVGAQLHAQSDGNPLFLAELLDALSRDGTLYRRGDRWVWSASTSLAELPKTIGKLLADRIDRLEPWMRACIECLAVAADDVPVAVLARSAGISEPRAELALSVLEEERLTKRTGGESFELIHDEFRRLVYHGIPDERRALLHVAIGTALVGLGEANRPGGAARLVYHFDQAGDVERARRYALLAAGEASKLSAPDALQSHLEIAAAHSPRPLPPRAGPTRARAQVATRRWRRFSWVLGAAVTAVAATVSVASRGWTGAERPTPDFRQGTMYLGPSRNLPATHRVVWAEQPAAPARIERMEELPQQVGNVVFSRAVSAEGETHTKLFLATGSDTIQLTDGPSDDGMYGWSPDRSELLVERGWRSEEWLFTVNLYRLRLAERRLERLTDTRYQDVSATWAPTGDRLAFRRDSLDSSSVWLADYDGGRPENLTALLGLPTRHSVPAFSRDGWQLAVIFIEAAQAPVELYLVDLRTNSSRLLARLDGLTRPRDLLWSPDSRWLAFTALSDGTWGLWVLASDGTSGPRLIAELPDVRGPSGVIGAVQISAWAGQQSQRIHRVEIEDDEILLAAYRGVSTRAKAFDQNEEALASRIRWSVDDTTVAKVDELGFLRGTTAGSTRLVASAGGFRADTIGVTVVPGGLDTLFTEDWSRGIDPSRWEAFGSPPPRVLREVRGVGSNVFWNNGDYNHPSGVFTRVAFAGRSAGLTVQVDGWLRLTGEHWQYWELDLPTGDVALLNDLEAVTREPGLGITGHSPVSATLTWRCGGAVSDWPPDAFNEVWSSFTVQLRPDGVIECYRDGRRFASGPVPEAHLGPDLAVRVMLAGSSEGTGIYHGPVLVLRGLKY